MGDNLAKHIAELPELLQPSVTRWSERLATAGQEIPEEYIPAVVRVVACSEFAGKVLFRDWAWFKANIKIFANEPDSDRLQQFVDSISTSSADVASVKAELRRYRNRYLLHVIWREVQHLADLDETLAALSLLADRLLEAATHYAEARLMPRFGQVRSSDDDVVPLVILGMGKLGGRELNFSSDIDIIFCYPDSGNTDGERTLSAQEYFTRLARQIIELIDEPTADGFVFRTDIRLRPFGDSGPHVVSFSALESYLLQHGRDWERYAYIKARIVGALPSTTVADDLYQNLIRPFVYRRYLDYGVFESVREMQGLIAAEVQRRELADNVKLGPGGIREAEFIVQALQLVRGGNEPALQCREFQTVLPRLVSERGLSQPDADAIGAAYRFLRRVENFIQAIRDEQTHDLPRDEIDQERLCLAMRYGDWRGLLADLTAHRDSISRQFQSVAIRDPKKDSQKGAGLFLRLWDEVAAVDDWDAALSADTGKTSRFLATTITEFASSSSIQQIDSISKERLQRFIPKLVSLVVISPSPEAALTRTLNVVDKVLRRSAYLALLNENPAALAKLVDLCARSNYIAVQIARYPVLLDELLDPGIDADGIGKNELADELQQRLDSTESGDSESKMQAIVLFQRAVMFRIAVADFSDQLAIMKVSDGLTWIAEVVLEKTLHVAWSDLVTRHGVPCYEISGVRHEAGFGIIGYGKLGGLELSYGSDLDIVFLHDSHGERQQTDGESPLDNALFFGRLVRRLVHFLTTQTGSGELYEIDMRLRPDGRSGVLVSNIEAFERYQEENAWTWEHQALLRARAVAGSDRIAAEFERVRRDTLSTRVRLNDLKSDVTSMRMRMREKLDESSESSFDLKHGVGGIGDIEFLVQYWVLRDAGKNESTTIYSDNIRQLDALIESASIEPEVGERLQEIYRIYRLHLHRSMLNNGNSLIEAALFVPERRFVRETWRAWLD